MAEFKDISLFEEVTPTYANAVNMWVQVSATEKVNLAAVAAMAKDAPIADAGGSPPPQVAGNWYFPGLKTASPYDTIFEAISKLAGISANFKLGIYDLRNYGVLDSLIGSYIDGGYAIISEISTPSGYEILYLTTEFIALVRVDSTTFESSKPSGILINGLSCINGNTEEGYTLVSLSYLKPTFNRGQLDTLKGGSINYLTQTTWGSTPVTVDEIGDNEKNSIVAIVNITGSTIPSFQLSSSLSGSTLYKCEGFDDVLKSNAGYVAITFQAVRNSSASSKTFAIFMNAAKYEAVL